MTIEDFRRLALSLPAVEESAHMGSPDFRVGGHIFASLAAQSRGFGNLLLSPEQQSEFLAEWPNLFLPVAGAWGRSGATHVRLIAIDEDILTAALRTAWKRRVAQNAVTRASKGQDSQQKRTQ